MAYLLVKTKKPEEGSETEKSFAGIHFDFSDILLIIVLVLSVPGDWTLLSLAIPLYLVNKIL